MNHSDDREFNYHDEFLKLARESTAEGVLTWKEVVGILRPGTSKCRYWGSNYNKLRYLLATKRGVPF
jgi:hypothetical protein